MELVIPSFARSIYRGRIDRVPDLESIGEGFSFGAGVSGGLAWLMFPDKLGVPVFREGPLNHFNESFEGHFVTLAEIEYTFFGVFGRWGVFNECPATVKDDFADLFRYIHGWYV